MKTPGGWNYRHVKDLLATTSTGFLLTGIEPAPVARVTNSSVKFKKIYQNQLTNQTLHNQKMWYGHNGVERYRVSLPFISSTSAVFLSADCLK